MKWRVYRRVRNGSSWTDHFLAVFETYQDALSYLYRMSDAGTAGGVFIRYP